MSNAEERDPPPPENPSTEAGAEEVDDKFITQTVRLTSHASRPDLIGRTGAIQDVDESSLAQVRLNLPGLTSETVCVPKTDLATIDEEDLPRVSVMWTYIRRLNTGNDGSLVEVLADAYAVDNEDESSLREISCTEGELHDFLTRMQFEEVGTPLCKKFGLAVRAFAHPHAEGDAHAGRDNVLAAGFTQAADGSTSTIVGTAFFVRMSPTSGQLVDFTHGEAVRALFYISDIVKMRDAAGPDGLADQTWLTLHTCFPFYEVGCRISEDGFFGLSGSMTRRQDGSFAKSPADLQPVSTHIS